MRLSGKDLLALEDLSRDEIVALLDAAEALRERHDGAEGPDRRLSARTVANLFYEPSTRTRVSFEIAERRLGIRAVTVTAAGSSVAKGETLLDTARTLEAMGVDLVVIRHAASGSARFLADRVAAAVVNAGDGAHEHPTQGLLDLLTIRRRLGRIAGLRVVLVGDVLHSRVARSNLWGLTKLGAHVGVCGPRTLLPPGIEELGVRVYVDLDAALAEADVVNVLRIQRERQAENLFPSVGEYRRRYGLTRARLERAPRHLLVLHPGPMNRGVEIDSTVADGDEAAILEQVTNGVAVRIAVLKALFAADGDAEDRRGRRAQSASTVAERPA